MTSRDHWSVQEETGAAPLAAIPIHNETDYLLTDSMTAAIVRDVHEHFGDEIQAIRVQAGLERHAFNVRTREVRYAFSPQDFGVGPPTPLAPESLAPEPLIPEPPYPPRRASRRAAGPEADILPTSLEDGEEDMEEATPLETSLDSLEDAQDDEDLFTMDDPTAEEDDEDEEEDDEDDSLFDPDVYGA
jgi:hypothetical protein